MAQVSIADIISAQWLLPGVHNKFDPSKAIRGSREMPRSLLLYVQIYNVLFNPDNFNKVLTITTDAEARGLLGAGSIGYQMWRAANKNAALGLPVRVIALPEPETAVANKRTLTVSVGGARASGEQAVYVGGERYSIGVTATDTAAQIATKLHAVLNVPDLPFTVAVNDAVITLTAKCKGTLANLIDIRTRLYPSDVDAMGVTLTVEQTEAGALDPSISTAIVNMQNLRDTEWVVPYTDGNTMTILEEELLHRWSHEVQTDVQAIVAMRGTEGQHTTWLDSRNNPLVHSIHTANDPTNPWETAAAAGAVIESMASTDPCVPHTGAVLVGYKAARVDEHLQPKQINNIMLSGGSSINVQADGTATLMRMVTNYTSHNTGAYDTSMRELNWIKNLSWFRWYRNTEFAIKTQGFKLGEYAEPIPGQKIMTTEVATDMMLGIYDNAIGLGRMQNRDYYTKTMLLEIEGPNGRLKIQDEPIQMNQLYQTAITSQWSAGHV